MEQEVSLIQMLDARERRVWRSGTSRSCWGPMASRWSALP